MSKKRKPRKTKRRRSCPGRRESGVRELVELSKTKGYVTYDDVNELLDEDVTEEADIEDVLLTLREYHVEVRDEAEPAAPEPGRRRRPEGEAAEEADSSPSSSSEDGGTDYVRMYMRDMAPCLFSRVKAKSPSRCVSRKGRRGVRARVHLCLRPSAHRCRHRIAAGRRDSRPFGGEARRADP